MGMKIYGNGGGSVELVADPTLATDEVVEISESHGIESGIGWIKFPDGTLICDGYVYENSTDYEVEYSHHFATQPSVTLTAKLNVPNLGTHKMAVQYSNTFSDLTHIRVTAEVANTEANYIAIGRWK